MFSGQTVAQGKEAAFLISRRGRGVGTRPRGTCPWGRWLLAALIRTPGPGAPLGWSERKPPLRGRSSPSQAQ